LALQIHPSPYFTGSQLPLAQAAGFVAEEHVLTAYGEGVAGIRGLLAAADMRRLDGGEKRLSIWPKAPQLTSDQDLAAVGELCARHGIGSLAIYHLGLLPWATIERIARHFTS
ncbi:MAG: hypothetical protein KDC98_03185, partial [Planctomycetes bacterium]|nr:hypothetical protein [Planctomycetota bacterium]